jgi:SAM-dependent methyltransferase
MSKPRLDTSRLQRLSWAFTESATLFAAIENGLFTAIAAGHDTIDALSRHTGINPKHVRRMLVGLVTLDLVEKQGERFANAPDVERFLDAGKPSYAGKWIARTGGQWDDWRELGKRLKTTAPPTLLGYHGELTVESARAYHEATYQVGMGAARKFMREVDLSDRRKLLDLGGGSGAYSIVAALTHPDIIAVVLDLPPVVEVARDFIRDNGVDDRVTAEVCDFTRDPLPSGADVILMNSNLPVYDDEIVPQVIAKAFAALEPGGEMFICGEMIADDWHGPLIPAMCGLMGVTGNNRAWAHTVSDCIGYFEAAGFEDVRVDEFIPKVLHRLRGRKPGARA